MFLTTWTTFSKLFESGLDLLSIAIYGASSQNQHKHKQLQLLDTNFNLNNYQIRLLKYSPKVACCTFGLK